MGTSKGYIAPTTPQWSQAKRAVTSYIKKGNMESRYTHNSEYPQKLRAASRQPWLSILSNPVR